MRVLVTGGAGYIGSHTCVELLLSGCEVLIVDNLSNANNNVLKRIERLAGKKVDFCKIDLRDTKSLISIFNHFRPETVIHFAGLKSVSESVLDPLKYYDTNVTGAISLLKAMDKVECKQIVFSSSATVYGEPQYLPYDENHPTEPINPYGISKLFVENLIRDWSSAGVQRYSIALRYFNPVGAHNSGMIGEDPNGTPNNLMPFVSQVAIGKRAFVNIFGNDYNTADGTGVRDYIHVSDLANAHLAAVKHLGSLKNFEFLNLGSGKGVTVLELIRSFEKVTGINIPKKFLNRREGDLPSFWASPRQAEKKINFSVKYNIDQMCHDTWKWQKNNPEGYNTKS
jgi:UDP-glucose 4-epimerase